MQNKLLFSTSSIRRKMKILESIKLENIDKSLMESYSSILLLKIKISKEEWFTMPQKDLYSIAYNY